MKLTLEQAARQLLLTRAQLVRLVAARNLGPVLSGSDGYQCVLEQAVADYQARRKAVRLAALEDLTDLTQRLGLYDDK